MQRCPTGALTSTIGHHTIIAPARCKRWRCPKCGPAKADELAKRIASTQAQRFLTLTARPSDYPSAKAQLDAMRGSWRSLWKQIRRRRPNDARGYVVIVELHKNNRPHLHILLDCGYLPQRWLSARWNELTGSPIVDIRAIRSEKGIARYLAKYLVKDAHGIKGRRKWSQSYRFLPPHEKEPLAPGELPLEWTFRRVDPDRLTEIWLSEGFEQVVANVLREPGRI